MSKRLKRDVIGRECEPPDSMNVGQCWDIYGNVPIREWDFSPETINIRWAENTPIPTSQLVTIVFAEVENLIENTSRQVRNVRYVITKSSSGGYTAADVIDLQGITATDLKNIPVKADGKVQFRISYKNFHLLQEGDNTIQIYLGIIGTVTENGITTENKELEKRAFSVVIRKVAKSEITSPHITTNKKEYHLTYIKNTNELRGDTKINVLIHNINTYRRRENGYISVYNLKSDSIGQNLKSDGWYIGSYDTTGEISIENIADWANIQVGTHKVVASVRYQYEISESFFSPRKNKVYLDPVEINIHITIKENDEGFELSKSHFEFTLLLHENKTASGTFQVQNPNNLPITIEKSNWINIQQSGNNITFRTLTAEELKVGRKQGTIEVISGSFRRIVNVIVIVEKTIDNSLSDVNFCLDKRQIIIRKQHSQAEFLKAHFKMAFQGYGKEYHTIEQTYEYVFFNNEVTLYPGEEVQDFFTEISELEQMQINEQDIVSPRNIFKACLTEITISEFDKNGVIYKTEKLNPIYFLPGKTPKAYPYLTNGTVRKTYTQSLICVSALREEFIGKNLGEIAGNMVDTTSVNIPKMVVTMPFRRFVADKTYGDKKNIKKGNLELIPITNPQEVIDVLFQNQNFCPDWFSFSGEIEQHEDITHTLSENIRNGKDFKAHVERKTTLKLNTGWLLEEEVELLTELIVSPLCFARIQGKWRRLIPISKKSLVYDNQANVRSFIVEFQVSE